MKAASRPRPLSRLSFFPANRQESGHFPAVRIISAKLYHVGILMYGKRATMPELVRWLRYR
jgi:hypothetical protein